MESEPPRRYVFDANILVSAFLFPQSTPGKSLELALRQHILLMSLEVAAELASVLRREKFDRYLTHQRREELLAGTIRDSMFIQTQSSIAVCRDPDDDKYLELAIDGKASAIVTGDADLLALGSYQGILIVSPRDFLATVASR